MSIRTSRNKVLRYRFGLEGLRSMRGPRRIRRSLARLAKVEAERRERSGLSAAAKAKAVESRRPVVSKPGAFSSVTKAARSLFNWVLGRRGN